MPCGSSGLTSSAMRSPISSSDVDAERLRHPALRPNTLTANGIRPRVGFSNSNAGPCSRTTRCTMPVTSRCGSTRARTRARSPSRSRSARKACRSLYATVQYPEVPCPPMVAVLLVEDDAAIRTALTRALREYGHAVTALGSGMPALTPAVENKPDVVLLDLGLPDVDGADVLSMLRAVSDVPVIVATARDDEAEMVRRARHRRRRLRHQAVHGAAAQRAHPGRAAPRRQDRRGPGDQGSAGW